MKSYNVKIYRYAEGSQIRVYDRPIISGRVKPGLDEGQKLSKEYKEEKVLRWFTQAELDIDKESRALHSQITSRNRTINRVYEIARSETWDYFITLTFSPQKVNRQDYDGLSNKLTNWLKNLKRRYAPDLKYIVVPELHKDGKSYHYHGLFKDIGSIAFVDSGHKDKKGRVIYNINNYALGWTTATNISSSYQSACYLTKYISKQLCAVTQGKKRYWASRNIDKTDIYKYYLEPDDIDSLLDDVSKEIVHIKKVEIPATRNCVTYYEVKDKK